MWIIIWLLVLAVSLVVEFLTLGLTSVWFAGGALIAALLALLGVPWPFQIAAFIIVSALLLILTRPVAVKYFNDKRVKTNVESMVGQKAIVLGEIDNLQGLGRVRVGTQDWSARSSIEDVRFAVGDVVKVVSVEGVKLIVEAVDTQQ